MNQKDFVDWKRHPVTQVVMSQISQRIKDLTDMLSESAGMNPLQDREYVGAIKAYRDFIEIQYEGEVEKE